MKQINVMELQITLISRSANNEDDQDLSCGVYWKSKPWAPSIDQLKFRLPQLRPVVIHNYIKNNLTLSLSKIFRQEALEK